jgi:hypothetical protein
MIRACLGACFCLLLTLRAYGQTGPAGFEALARRGIGHVYNLEFENAEKEFRELVRQKPGDPAGYFFLAMVRWWMIMIDIDDERYDREFYGALDGVIGMCDSLLEKEPG